MTPGVIVKAFNVEKPFDIEQFLRVESRAGNLRPSSVVRLGYLLVEKVELDDLTTVDNCAKSRRVSPKSLGGGGSSSPLSARKSYKVLSNILKRSQPGQGKKELAQMGWTQVLAVQNGSLLRFYATKPQRQEEGHLQHVLLETLDLTTADITHLQSGRPNAHQSTHETSSTSVGGLMYHAPRPARLLLTTQDAQYTINVGTDLLTGWWQTCLEKSVQVSRERTAAILKLQATSPPRYGAKGATPLNLAIDSPIRKDIPTPIIAAPQIVTPPNSSTVSASSEPPLRTISTAFQRDMTPGQVRPVNLSDPILGEGVRAAADKPYLAPRLSSLEAAFSEGPPHRSRGVTGYPTSERDNGGLLPSPTSPSSSTSSSSASPSSAVSFPKRGPSSCGVGSGPLDWAQSEGQKDSVAAPPSVCPATKEPSPTLSYTTTACNNSVCSDASLTFSVDTSDRESILSLDFDDNDDSDEGANTNPKMNSPTSISVMQPTSFVRVRSSGYTVISKDNAQPKRKTSIKVNPKRMSRYFEDSPLANIDFSDAYEVGRGLAAALDSRMSSDNPPVPTELSPTSSTTASTTASTTVQAPPLAAHRRVAPVPPPKPRRSLIRAVASQEQLRRSYHSGSTTAPPPMPQPTLAVVPVFTSTVSLKELTGKKSTPNPTASGATPHPASFSAWKSSIRRPENTTMTTANPASSIWTMPPPRPAHHAVLGPRSYPFVPQTKMTTTMVAESHSDDSDDSLSDGLEFLHPTPSLRRLGSSPNLTAVRSMDLATYSQISQVSLASTGYLEGGQQPASALMASPVSTTSTAVNSPVLTPLAQLSRLNKSAHCILSSSHLSDLSRPMASLEALPQARSALPALVGSLDTKFAPSSSLSFSSQSSTDTEEHDDDDEYGVAYSNGKAYNVRAQKQLPPTPMNLSANNPFLALLNNRATTPLAGL
ncbi:hypothetical protein BJ085DRAFT_28317 [Dimargaris cristalligena]|uniref:PH domain-containing protein n=1 Tax=Dimargaris cristalligena TaxID=215637 RepID=A0A4P9ZR93_9FUNG|nr:hypothetical protein BJ085DRAFT_28317 [Dimargaris cristalligena]|eukprot:RKP35678.1 hypothetical protein BJ085DRAFT_28317 [Dimargaris cristalligena]